MPQYQNIFDSHAHYTDNAFDDDRDALLTQLPADGVSQVMVAASDLPSAAAGIQLARRFPYIYAAVGVHPEEAADAPPDYLAQLRAMTEEPKVRAIGEIGLDYHYENFDRDLQLRLFREQLALARERNLPVIIHARDATADTMTILREEKPVGVMHCFSGSAETAKELLSLGMYLSFTGVLTFRNARKSLEALDVVPIERLLTETDCPYMAPVPHRGKRCDSRMIADTAQVIAERKGIPVQEVLDKTNGNAKRLFGIS